MKKIKLNEKEVEIITSIDEITLKKFEEIMLSKKQAETPLDEFIQNLQILSTLTLDEIEEMDLMEFQELMKEVKLESFQGYENTDITEIEILGIKYKAKSTGMDYKFNVKEMFLLSDSIKTSPELYVSFLAGVIFKKTNDDGSIINDLSIESVKERQVIFGEHMKMNVITPYLIKLSEYYQVKS